MKTALKAAKRCRNEIEKERREELGNNINELDSYKLLQLVKSRKNEEI